MLDMDDDYYWHSRILVIIGLKRRIMRLLAQIILF